VLAYLTFMGLLCVIPYIEENLRCWRALRDGTWKPSL
jgi:hypothetical protein